MLPAFLYRRPLQKYRLRYFGKAFYRNSTDMRIIEREDVVLWDTDAVVYAEFASIKDAVPDNETPSTGDTEDKSVDVGK